MVFQINQHATLPKLQMELINDGGTAYNEFHQCIQDSVITFCMTDTETGAKVVGNRPALCVLKTSSTNPLVEEYLIGYQFSERETRKAGRYIGEFTITFNNGDGTLITPIKEQLFIDILDNGIKK